LLTEVLRNRARRRWSRSTPEVASGFDQRARSHGRVHARPAALAEPIGGGDD
jgi:hypothetical protein